MSRPNKLAKVKRAPGGQARVFVGTKMALAARDEIDGWAAEEVDGNRSEMIRRMLAESAAMRRARPRRR